MRTPALFLGCLLALSACASDGAEPGFDPEAAPGLEARVAQAKADGAFGSREISLGATVSGTTAGDGVVLYSINLDEGDQFRIDITRTSGDLSPAAYLYQNVETFVRPIDYDVRSDAVELNFAAAITAEHFIAVRAYRGEGGGDFSLSVTCTGGPCAGGSALTGVARADQCLVRAGECFLRRLPSFNGRVGAATATRVLAECLEDEGDDCVDACDAAPDLAHTCGVIIDELPRLADTPETCLAALGSCLDTCTGVGFYGYGEDEFMSAPTCWDGHQGSSSSATGHCIEYIDGLDVCGGDRYALGSPDACNAFCASTDGAWDEGPWDACTSECSDLQAEIDAFIADIADRAGEYVSVDSDPALQLVEWGDIPSEVRNTAEDVASFFIEDANAAGRTDTASARTEEPLAIYRDGEIVGYVVIVDYMIDDPLFDGGGVNVYINLEADIVEEVEWFG